MIAHNSVGVPACPPLQFASVSSGTLSYRSNGAGRALVFLHGLLGNSQSWAFQYEHFARMQQVIAWDAPGFGQSDMVEPSLNAYVVALRDLLDILGQNEIILVGHSMGGTVAARFAAVYPNRVDRLVLSCTHPGYGQSETAPMSEKFESRMRELRDDGPKEYGIRRANELLPRSCPALVLEYAAELASQTNPEGLRRATRALQLADIRPLLPKLKMSVLVLTGEKDTTVLPMLKADLLRLTPITRHVDMLGLGHAPYLQAPDVYNSLIDAFLAEP
jgi:pimeloyl-ACP methyl ester carboxylesterase